MPANAWCTSLQVFKEQLKGLAEAIVLHEEGLKTVYPEAQQLKAKIQHAKERVSDLALDDEGNVQDLDPDSEEVGLQHAARHTVHYSVYTFN